MTTLVFPANAVSPAATRTSSAAASMPVVTNFPINALIEAAFETLGCGYDTSKRQLSTVKVLHPNTQQNVEIVNSKLSNKIVVNRDNVTDANHVKIHDKLNSQLSVPSNPDLCFSLRLSIFCVNGFNRVSKPDLSP